MSQNSRAGNGLGVRAMATLPPSSKKASGGSRPPLPDGVGKDMTATEIFLLKSLRRGMLGVLASIDDVLEASGKT